MPAVSDVIACPRCGAADVAADEAVVRCGSCGAFYPVVDGVPRFLGDLPADARQVQRVFDFEHRRFRDSWYTRFEPRLVDLFLKDCELARDFFAGKRVLDAGCGSGRWTYALAHLGADVAAFDLTDGGLQAVRGELGERDGVLLCQGDLLRPPFRAESFDFVMSWGVLHHTRDTHAAFERLVPLVRRGGILYVMVYERYSSVRRLGTEALRMVLRRLSDERRYRFCRHLVVESPKLAALLSPFLMIAHYDRGSAPVDRASMQFGLFDAYSPRYNHVHSRAEVAGWFEAAGFGDVTVLDTPPGSQVKVRGKRL